MMGQQTGGQQRLFYAFNLEEHIPYSTGKTTIKSLQETNEKQALDLLHKQSELEDACEQNQSQREALAKEIGRRETLESSINERDLEFPDFTRHLTA